MRQFLRLLAPLAPERVWVTLYELSYEIDTQRYFLFDSDATQAERQHSQAAGKIQIFTRFTNQIEYISSVGM